MMRPRDELQAIIAHDPLVMGHEFVQDPEDIPGGCKTCWANLEDANVDKSKEVSMDKKYMPKVGDEVRATLGEIRRGRGLWPR